MTSLKRWIGKLSCFYPGRLALFAATLGLVVVLSTGVIAAPADKAAVVPATKLPGNSAAAGAVALSRVLPRGGTLAMPALSTLAKREQLGVLTDLVRFFTDNRMELLSGNHDNALVLKPLADSEVEVFSGNNTKLLSDNRPALFNGNTLKFFSDVSIFSGINVNVNVRIEKSGNKVVGDGGENGLDAAFRQLDLDGDGKVSAEEFRAGMSQ